MMNEELTQRTRETVMAMSGGTSREAVFASLHQDLVLEEPSFLPYGGVHHGVDGFRDVLVAAAKILDLSSVKLESVLVDGDHAVRFLRVRLLSTGEEVAVAEEMRLREGKVASIRVFWFEPSQL